MDSSNLKTYCIGVVAVTKKPGDDIISVYPTEKLAYEDGDVATNSKEVKITGKNASGVSFTSASTRNSTIEARWFSDGLDGRQTAPDVVAGETVRVYRFADSEVFYWKTIFREPALRRLEHVVYAYSNLPSGRTPFGNSSSYGQLFSTLDKKISIWTSSSNGEKFSYQCTLDAKNSTVRIQDNVANTVGINSSETEVFIKNSKGTTVSVIGEKIILSSKVAVDLKTKGFTMSGENVTVNGNVKLNSERVDGTGTINAKKLTLEDRDIRDEFASRQSVENSSRLYLEEIKLLKEKIKELDERLKKIE